VIPVLDEAARIGTRLAEVAALGVHETIVVDGGSRDATRAIAAPLADRLVDAPRGRASQMNAGARAARGAVIVFLHADTVVPPGAIEGLAARLERSGRSWGRFDVAIAGAETGKAGAPAAARRPLRSRYDRAPALRRSGALRPPRAVFDAASAGSRTSRS
jgi:glycosyltransferase involved in cell wall biosynthesis